MTDTPKLAFISAKCSPNGRDRKHESGHKPEHTEALLEDAARQVVKEESGEESKDNNRESSNT